MNAILRKTAKISLKIVACIAIVLMCAEAPDGGISLPWNLGWLAALIISARLLDRMGAFDKYNDD